MKIVETFKHEEIKGFKFGYLPIGRPRLFSYIYFVDGLLIDTGHSRMRKSILSEMENLDIEKIFITHHHEDHSGNIKPIRSMANCKVYGSELCCEMMKNPPRMSLAQKLLWGNRESINYIEPIDNFISTNNYKFEIIPIPGHASDMVALYERKKKWLFSADLYINSYIGYFLPEENIFEQINSIENILKLDFDVLLCSHNPKFQNGKKALIKKKVFFQKFIEDVSSLHAKGLQPTQIFNKLKLKEQRLTNLMSGGHLSKMNMVKSVIKYSDKHGQ